MSETKLWIMCGVPGSGKSYYAKNHLMKNDGTWAYISRDEVRFSLVKENEEYFSKEKQVFKEFIKQIHYACLDEDIKNVIIDATHLNKASRMKLINAIFPYGLDINILCIWMETPLEVCLARNAKREGRACVPNSAIRRMWNSSQFPSKDEYDYEGIFKVTQYEDKYLVMGYI